MKFHTNRQERHYRRSLGIVDSATVKALVKTAVLAHLGIEDGAAVHVKLTEEPEQQGTGHRYRVEVTEDQLYTPPPPPQRASPDRLQRADDGYYYASTVDDPLGQLPRNGEGWPV